MRYLVLSSSPSRGDYTYWRLRARESLSDTIKQYCDDLGIEVVSYLELSNRNCELPRTKIEAKRYAVRLGFPTITYQEIVWRRRRKIKEQNGKGS